MSSWTSHTHPLNIDEVPAGDAGGAIGITLCPGKVDYPWNRSLDLDLDAIAHWKPHAMLTLIETHEFDLLGVPRLGERARARGIAWQHLPIGDMQPPDVRFEQHWKTEGPRLCTTLREGGRVLVHCRAGLGRAGTVAALMLVGLGVPGAEAVARVRAARPGTIQTEEQERYVLERGGGSAR